MKITSSELRPAVEKPAGLFVARISHAIPFRHAWPCAGHPRLEVVDGRVEPGHDDRRRQVAARRHRMPEPRAALGAISLAANAPAA